MTFLECLEKYKTEDCYGPFCSPVTCGKHSVCRNKKCNNKYWYPDKIKDKVLAYPKNRGIKTCDILDCNSQGIFILEMKPATKDVKAKVNGTCKVLAEIYPQFGKTELKRLKAFLLRCDPKQKINQGFRDVLDYLSETPTETLRSLYCNNTVELYGVTIPITYHRTCKEFLAEGIENHFK